MKKTILVTPIFLVVLVLFIGIAAADRLPNQTPENQVFTMASSVEAIGSYSGSQNLQWTTGYDPEPSLINNFPTDPTDPLVKKL